MNAPLPTPTPAEGRFMSGAEYRGGQLELRVDAPDIGVLDAQGRLTLRWCWCAPTGM